MSDRSVVEQVKHYQRDIVKCPDNPKRMLRCIERLTVLPVTIAHLQETGVGRSVNELRKCGGEVGAAAGALVCKWKSMVTNEEEESAPESDVEAAKEQSSLSEYKNNSSHRSGSPHKNKQSHNSEYHRKSEKNDSSHKNKQVSNSEDHRKSERTDSSQKYKHVHNNDDSRKSVSSHSSNKKTEDTRNESKSSRTSDHKSSTDHKSNRDKSTKSGYGSNSDSRHSSSHKSRNDGNSRFHKDSRHGSDSEGNENKKNDKSHSKAKYDDTKLKKSSSVTSLPDSKTKDIKYKMDKEKHRRDESSHKQSSSKKYDLKRIESESSDDDTVYKPSNRKRKKSDSDEEQRYESKKHHKSSFSKESVKKKHFDSSEESEVESGTNEEDEIDNEGTQSQHNSESEDEISNKSVEEDNVSGDESESEGGRSSVENSESPEESRSRNSSDSEQNDSSPEREEYVPVKIKREKESPERHSKSYNSEKKYKSDQSKNNHSSSSSSKNYKINNVTIKQEKECENVKIKKERVEKDNLIAQRQKEKKVSEDKTVKKSSSSHSESSSKQIKTDKKVKIKIEKEEDGSIDCESGASFADALMGLSDTKKKSIKKKPIAQEKSRPPENQRSSIKLEPHSSPSSSSKSSFKEPDLLSKHVKLEPLDVDLKATLPEISPHYKPLPHYSPPGSPASKKAKLLSQEEALSTIMSTKNQRTKVYSGNKTGFTKVPSLFDLCIQVLRENIEALEYTGGVPYDLLKPVLDRATADQLYQLEHYNPYLVEDTDGLWQFHCNKDFRGKKPEEFETWRELYLRLLDERERKLEALKANITQSMAKSTPIRQTKLAYVDSVVKPPRNVARKQMKFGTSKAVKHDLVAKAMVGTANKTTPSEAVSVPAPPAPSRSSSSSSSFPIPNFLKKKKAPLMAKTLQLIKGNRFKR